MSSRARPQPALSVELVVSRPTTPTAWIAATTPDAKIGIEDLQTGVVQLALQGDGCLASPYLDCPNQTITGGGGLTILPSEYYPAGNLPHWNVTDMLASQYTLVSASDWPGPKGEGAYVVEIEFTLVSGGLSGAGVRVDWQSTGTNTSAAIRLDDHVSAPVLGQRYLVRARIDDPGYTGTLTGNRVYLFAGYRFSGLGPIDPKEIRFHRLQVYPADTVAGTITNIAAAIGDYAIGA